jgi:carbonic anhydrase
MTLSSDAQFVITTGAGRAALLDQAPGDNHLAGSRAVSAEPFLARNRAWSARMCSRDAEFFLRLARQQVPECLWIGCSDSRVAANQILDLAPGEVFVHRNVANVVATGDLNCLSVLQFAVDVLKVRHVMVVGHYGCGGIRAAVEGLRLGLVDGWLRHIHDVQARHRPALMALPLAERADRLCELNVAEQFANVCRTDIVQDAWERGQTLSVHGWVYELQDGLLREQGLSASHSDEADEAYREAIDGMSRPVAGTRRRHAELRCAAHA